MSSPIKMTMEVVPSLPVPCQVSEASSSVLHAFGLDRAAPSDIVLSDGSSCNHDSSGVLYLHFSQQDVAVLCELDVCK